MIIRLFQCYLVFQRKTRDGGGDSVLNVQQNLFNNPLLLSVTIFCTGSSCHSINPRPTPTRTQRSLPLTEVEKWLSICSFLSHPRFPLTSTWLSVLSPPPPPAQGLHLCSPQKHSGKCSLVSYSNYFS